MVNLINDTGNVPEHTILVSFDVESLFTNVPHLEGLDTLRHVLNNTRAHSLKPSNDCIVKLADLVLSYNYFRFQSDYYLQTKGTAMGSPMAPNFANLYVGQFEEHVLFGSNHPLLSNVLVYKRYIDDILVIWGGTMEQLQEFHTLLNSLSTHLKFTNMICNMI